MNSTHRVEVCLLEKIDPHPNADRLGLTTVHDAYQVVVALDSWKEGQLVAYIPPDSVVDTTRPEFDWLQDMDRPERTTHRVKVKKLRGIFSQGLLVPAPEGSKVGDDVAEILGVTHYEPPEKFSQGDSASPPAHDRPVYGLESFRRYGKVLQVGEPVIETEKIHGTNARFTTQDDVFFAGSRNLWRKESPTSLYWQAVEKYPGIRKLVESNPGITLYGEIYGQVQDLTYGKTGIDFAAFDILGEDGNWWSWGDLVDRCTENSIPMVPVLYVGPFDPEATLDRAEGRSTIPGANCVREGCVVRPLVERWDHSSGRVHLKAVGNGYLEKSK